MGARRGIGWLRAGLLVGVLCAATCTWVPRAAAGEGSPPPRFDGRLVLGTPTTTRTCSPELEPVTVTLSLPYDAVQVIASTVVTISGTYFSNDMTSQVTGDFVTRTIAKRTSGTLTLTMTVPAEARLLGSVRYTVEADSGFPLAVVSGDLCRGIAPVAQGRAPVVTLLPACGSPSTLHLDNSASVYAWDLIVTLPSGESAQFTRLDPKTTRDVDLSTSSRSWAMSVRLVQPEAQAQANHVFQVYAGTVEFADCRNPVAPTDFNGDGLAEIGVFRPSDGKWYLTGGAIAWGTRGDLPVPGDYYGRRIASPAVFRPSNGRWYVFPDKVGRQFGAAGDIPVPGQWDDDPEADLAVWRPSDGRWYVEGTPGSIPWGARGDIPVPLELGDGRLHPAVFRPSSGKWYTPGATIAHGANGDLPVAANWLGDSSTELAVYRRGATSRFFIWDATPVSFGTTGDLPVPGQYWGGPNADLMVYRKGASPTAPSRWFLQGGPSWTLGVGGDIPLGLPAALVVYLGL